MYSQLSLNKPVQPTRALGTVQTLACLELEDA